jgi:hypothetical protein
MTKLQDLPLEILERIFWHVQCRSDYNINDDEWFFGGGSLKRPQIGEQAVK